MQPLYPRHIVRTGESDAQLVRLLQRQLNLLGCGPLEEDGEFGANTRSAVSLFQARHTDEEGQALKIDGEVGPLTWAALFGDATVPHNAATAPLPPLLRTALQIAAGEIGVLEQPLYSNRGPEVDAFIRRTGLTPPAHWCMCFVYWCFDEAARQLQRPNPCIRTGGVIDHWQRARRANVTCVTAAAAQQDPSLVRPGQLFVIETTDNGASFRTGHIGFVEQLNGGKLTTIEGNTNAGGSRNGIGVFRRAARKINTINVGFIDYNA